MVSKVINLIKEYKMIEKGDLVAAGVSGGADSLCLLFMLLEYQKSMPFEIVVVHVNHGIRKEASLDAAYVRDFCENQKLPFYLKQVDVKALAKTEHLSEEEAGRKVRYEAFEEALEQYGNFDKTTLLSSLITETSFPNVSFKTKVSSPALLASL